MAIESMPFENEASDSVLFLEEQRELDQEFGLGLTWSVGTDHIDLEIYYVLLPETVQTIGLSLLSVVCIVLFITFNF